MLRRIIEPQGPFDHLPARLTAKSFHALHPGKSINTSGFVMAAIRELGLIRAA